MDTKVKNDIVDILIEDEVLIRSWSRFFDALGIKESHRVQLHDDFVRGVINVTELFRRIINLWKAKNETATVDDLIKILETENFGYVSGKLKIFRAELKKTQSSTVTTEKPANSRLAGDTEETERNVDIPDFPVSDQSKMEARNTKRRSEVDPTRTVDDGTWVVSLVRNSHREKNREHTFIVLEGVEEDKTKTWFMDFTADRYDENKDTEKGTIRIQKVKGKLGDSTLFFCTLPMMKIHDNGKIAHYTCALSSDLGRKLVNTVKSDIDNQRFPLYRMPGRNSIFSYSSAASDSKGLGHNCYSWAHAQLKSLKDKTINDTLPNDWLKPVWVMPSRHLISKEPAPSDWYSKTVPYFLIAILMALLAFCYYIFIVFKN